MLNFIILTFLFVTSILAALFSEDMATALIAAEDAVTLEKTFKIFEKEQNVHRLARALTDVAKQGNTPKVVTCLRIAHDPFPEDKMCVSRLVQITLFEISTRTFHQIESFTNAITSFKPSDAKLLTTIRICTFWRDDAVNVLKGVMTKSPELITHDLPSWIALHSLDRNSDYYRPSFEESFKYLTSFATEDVLAEALSIVKRNEHYKVVYETGHTEVECCNSQNHFPQDLFNKINVLLGLMKARKALINELAILPKVLVDLMLEYTTCDIPPNCSKSTPEASESVLGKRSSRLQSRTSHKKSKQGQ